MKHAIEWRKVVTTLRLGQFEAKALLELLIAHDLPEASHDQIRAAIKLQDWLDSHKIVLPIVPFSNESQKNGF